MKILLLDNKWKDKYDSFILENETTLLYISNKYRELLRAFLKVQDCYFLAVEKGDILGVFPAFLNNVSKLGSVINSHNSVPFLDNDLVDFAMRTPVKLKLRNINRILKIDEDSLAKREQYFEKMRDGKIILRKVLNKYLSSNLSRQHKQGFSGPDASWFRGESINYVKEKLLNKRAKVYNYLDFDVSKNLIDEHISGKFNRRLFIWSMLCFEEWLKIFF